MWPFRRKKKEDGNGVRRHVSSQEYATVLKTHLDALKRPPLAAEAILGLCDDCVARGKEHDAEFMPGWMKAASEAGSLLLVKLLAERHPGVMPSSLARTSEKCTEGGFVRALSVTAAIFARSFGEAQAEAADGDFRADVFSNQIASMIDPFGGSFADWVEGMFQEVKEHGGEPIEYYWLLLGLHVAMWAPTVPQMPATVDEAHAVLPVPRSEAFANAGSLSYAFDMIQIASVGDFLPRLQEAMSQGSD